MDLKTKKRKIAFLMSVATLLTIITAGVKENEINPKNPSLDDANVLIKNESGIKISALSKLNVNDDNTVSKTITATVLDKDAPDKSVDWEIDWSDDAPLIEEDISDYLTVTPEEDGSTTAFLTCKKSFRGSTANLKVTTRIGKFEAVCLISYEGIPSRIDLNTASLAQGENNENFIYYLPVSTNEIQLNLDNTFKDVGEKYYNDVSISSEGIGSINVATYNMTATHQGWAGNDKTIGLDSIKDDIFSISYQNRLLTIAPKMKVESYYDGFYGNSYGCTYNNKFRSYVDNSAGISGITPYFRIHIQSGEAKTTFSFRLVSNVTGVNIDQSITF